MSDTPRTDGCLTEILDAYGFVHQGNCPQRWVNHARELERELNVANERIKRLEEESESDWMLAESAIGSCAEMSSRIKRLEEAGDEIEMILLQYASRAELPRTMAIEQSDLSKRLCVNWRKAKEDKL